MRRALDRITDLLGQSANNDRKFPPTLLFAEGWILRLVLDWFAANRLVDHPLAFDEGSIWFSEATLTSAFLPRYRGDKYAEGFTHADGAIGHFKIGGVGKADLSILPDATVIKVTEAKMFSALSRGTTRAPKYNQAARNVACIGEILKLSNRWPSEFRSLGFYVLAPRSQIEGGVFERAMNRTSICDVVKDRVKNYDDPKDDWFETWFRAYPVVTHTHYI